MTLVLGRIRLAILPHVSRSAEPRALLLDDWDEVAFIILMILVVVTGIDACSRAVRLRVIRGAR
jgi:ABC-type phosphate/phosphonate transport system permease subunit